MTKTSERERQLLLYNAAMSPGAKKEAAELNVRFRREDEEEAERQRPVVTAPSPQTPRKKHAADPRYKPKPAPKRVLPAPTKAAGVLVRVSTEDQSRSGYSKDDQLKWGRAEAARLGLRLIEYVEEGGAHSDMLDREALNQLEQDIVDGKVGTLLLRYGDRLGRGVVFTKLIEWLKAWRIVIRCGDLPESGDATDQLMSFYGAQGGVYLKTLRSRTADGVANAKAAGKHVGGDLLGFRWQDGQWVPERWASDWGSPEQAALKPWQLQRVRQAVTAYREGAGAFAALLEERRKSSRDRHMAARKRQEIRNNVREQWLLANRPITIERIAL
ncbi:MAG TPA: recombinase family protein [Thermoplasmata archaeon]|nr:recombinase family protein [Thermoplasmata archaeon]